MRLPSLSNSGLDDLANLKKFIVRLLNGIVIRGVPGIKAVSFRQDKNQLELKDGVYKTMTQYVLDTDGTNFQAVMTHPMVDGRRLVSSHVHDIYENLGIEATRQVLLNEISTLFEEAGVNYRHLGLLCDVMTTAGRLMSVDRYGINRKDIGPIAKASFEETEKILLRASVFGEIDPVTGVSANIMTGQTIRGGTAFTQLLLDEDALLRLQQGLPPMEDDEEDDTPEATEDQIAAELQEDSKDACSTAHLRMNVIMPQQAVLVEEPDIELAVIE
jgi:DNA-directed RNA polymerase II subunit RPB1